MLSFEKKFKKSFFGKNAWSAKILSKSEFSSYSIYPSSHEFYIIQETCVKRWASLDAPFLRYYVLKFEKNKIEEIEKTAFKVKSPFFHQNKAIRSKFDFQTLKKLLQIMTNNFVGQNKVKTVCWRLRTGYIFVSYTLFLPFSVCFLYKKNAKRGIPDIFKKLSKIT